MSNRSPLSTSSQEMQEVTSHVLEGSAPESEMDAAQERRRRAQAEQERWAKKVAAPSKSVHHFDIVYPDGRLMTAEDVTQKEFLEMEVVLDSGAGAHVASKDHLPGFDVVSSALSRAGAAFVGADGSRIKNYGEVALNMVTKDQAGKAHEVLSSFQIADVTRALWSVGLICDAGLKVEFAATHATVRDPKGNALCHFERRDDLYVAKVNVRNPAYKPNEQGFRRQGPQ